MALVMLAACGGGDAGAPTATVTEAPPKPSAADASGSWEPVAPSPSPLPASAGATTVWTGEEVLVFSNTVPTPGPLRHDGAAYDPEEDSWRRLAPMPNGLNGASTAVVGDTVYFLGVLSNDFFAYSLAEDTWRRLAKPPLRAAKPAVRLAVIGDAVVAFRWSADFDSRDQVWDADAERWRALPPIPDESLTHRSMVDAGGVGVLVGRRPDTNGRGFGLAAVTFDPDTRRWILLRFGKGRDGRGLTSHHPQQPLHAASGKVISASPDGERSWQGNNELLGGILDLAEGWSRLPARPLPEGQREGPVEQFSWLNVGGDGFVVAGGWAFDVDRGTWQPVPSAGPVDLGAASAVWAGDRVFAWGGVKVKESPSEDVADGWTWRPHRRLL